MLIIKQNKMKLIPTGDGKSIVFITCVNNFNSFKVLLINFSCFVIRFEGLNIMLVTMTSRVILLLSNLADELKIEGTGDAIVSTKQETFDVFAKTGAVQRLQFILTLIPIPELLLDLFFAANEKVCLTLMFRRLLYIIFIIYLYLISSEYFLCNIFQISSNTKCQVCKKTVFFVSNSNLFLLKTSFHVFQIILLFCH